MSNTTTDLIARLRKGTIVNFFEQQNIADALETLQRERDEAVRDAERARQDRAHVGVEIRREWMTKCAELQRERDDLKSLLKAVSPRAFAQMEKIRSEA
jgi:acyl-CoA reductase-like NAD-dependent aldehyde dehydrogenase